MSILNQKLESFMRFMKKEGQIRYSQVDCLMWLAVGKAIHRGLVKREDDILTYEVPNEIL